GPARRMFIGPDNFVVMDPASPRRCSVFSINYTKLDVRLYSVTPEDWPKWFYDRGADDEERLNKSARGRLVSSKAIAVRGKPNAITETNIDLSPGLTNGYGQMILIIEPSGGKPVDEDEEPKISESWIQVTNIGLDAFVDHTD